VRSCPQKRKVFFSGVFRPEVIARDGATPLRQGFPRFLKGTTGGKNLQKELRKGGKGKVPLGKPPIKQKKAGPRQERPTESACNIRKFFSRQSGGFWPGQGQTGKKKDGNDAWAEGKKWLDPEAPWAKTLEKKIRPCQGQTFTPRVPSRRGGGKLASAKQRVRKGIFWEKTKAPCLGEKTHERAGKPSPGVNRGEG